jgi:hypothetical protein
MTVMHETSARRAAYRCYYCGTSVLPLQEHRVAVPPCVGALALPEASCSECRRLAGRAGASACGPFALPPPGILAGRSPAEELPMLVPDGAAQAESEAFCRMLARIAHVTLVSTFEPGRCAHLLLPVLLGGSKRIPYLVGGFEGRLDPGEVLTIAHERRAGRDFVVVRIRLAQQGGRAYQVVAGETLATYPIHPSSPRSC